MGFTKVSNAMLRCPHLSMGAKLTYALLQSYAWETGECFPGQRRLAGELGVTPRSLRAYLQELEQGGLISERRRGNGQTNRYWISSSDGLEIGSSFTSERKKTTHPDGKKTAHHDGKKTTHLDGKIFPTNKTQRKEDTEEEDGDPHLKCLASFEPPQGNLWSRVKAELGPLGPVHQSWIRRAKGYEQDGRLVVQASSHEDRLWIEARLQPALFRALEECERGDLTVEVRA